jgi:hypothetical protein
MRNRLDCGVSLYALAALIALTIAPQASAVPEHWLRRSLGSEEDGECWSTSSVAVAADGSIVIAPYPTLQRVDPVLWAIDPDFQGPPSNSVADIAIGVEDRIYVLSVLSSSRVDVLDKNGGLLFSFGSSGSDPGEFYWAAGIDSNAEGEIVIADTHNYRIQVFDSEGTFLRSWPTPNILPTKIALDSRGSAFVLGADVNTSNKYIFCFDANGALIDAWGEGLFWDPSGIDVDAEGFVYVSDYDRGSIRRFTPKGDLVSIISDNQQLPSRFFKPDDVAVAPNGFVYTGDGNCSLLEFWYAGTMVRASTPTIEFSVDGERFVGSNVFRWPANSVHQIATVGTQFPTLGVKYDFEDWDGDAAISKNIVATDPPSTHTANFQTSYQLSYEIEGVGSCTPPPGWFPKGSQVSLAAHPEEPYALYEWIGEGNGSYTGRSSSPEIRMNGPIEERVVLRKRGSDFTISASDTDPFVVSANPAGGVRNLYLWQTCADHGVSAFEADVAGSLKPLAFIPGPSVLNVYGADRLLLAIGVCWTTESNRLLGHWIVDDQGGDLCLVPSAETGRIATADCHVIDPHLWENPRVFCFSSNGDPQVIGTDGCVDGAGPILITNFTARPRIREIELVWEASGGPNLSGFRVERANAAEGPFLSLHDSPLRVEPPCHYEDREVAEETTYFYRVIALDHSGNEVVSAPLEVVTPRWPHMITKLEPIWPNPTAGRAAISFALASPGRTKLAIYDVAGRLVKTIVDGDLEAGTHRMQWKGTDDSGQVNLPGVYFARLEAAGFTQTRKILYLRER